MTTEVDILNKGVSPAISVPDAKFYSPSIPQIHEHYSPLLNAISAKCALAYLFKFFSVLIYQVKCGFETPLIILKMESMGA
jgi:hypothetical protein